MSRLIAYEQGPNLVAADTNYPVTILSDLEVAASNSAGVRVPEVREESLRCRFKLAMRVSAPSNPSTTGGIYGYVDKATRPDGTVLTYDYAGADVLLMPWEHIFSLNNGAPVDNTFQQILPGPINVNAPDAQSLVITEWFTLSSIYKRVLYVPAIFGGTAPIGRVQFAFRGA